MSLPDNNDIGDKTEVIAGDQATLKAELQKAKEQEACLIIIRGQPQGYRFSLTHEDMNIGRDASAEISVSSDRSISRKHAKITRENGKIFITDLGSANGTLINGTKVETGGKRELKKEDMVKLGNTILKFVPAGEYEILFYGDMNNKAYTDALTHIFNKRYLLERLEAEVKRAKSLETDLALVFFDLDHFKKINDTYGHEAGDYVLKEACAMIRATNVGPKDVFARYGGEEFVIMYTNANAQYANEAAEKIRAMIQAHAFVYEGKRLPVTISMGVAELNLTTSTSQKLLKEADAAAYKSKEAGRNKVTVSNN